MRFLLPLARPYFARYWVWPRLFLLSLSLPHIKTPPPPFTAAYIKRITSIKTHSASVTLFVRIPSCCHILQARLEKNIPLSGEVTCTHSTFPIPSHVSNGCVRNQNSCQAPAVHTSASRLGWQAKRAASFARKQVNICRFGGGTLVENCSTLENFSFFFLECNKSWPKVSHKQHNSGLKTLNAYMVSVAGVVLASFSIP